MFLKSGWQLGAGESDLTCPTVASMSGARQQRAAEVDSIAVPWIGVGVGKRNLKEGLVVLIPNSGGLGKLFREETCSWDHSPLGSGVKMIKEVRQLARGQKG